MKKGQWKNGSSVCPYYKWENRYLISCSGLADNSSVHLAFGLASDCIEHKVNRCRSEFKQCNVYRMLEEMNDE